MAPIAECPDTEEQFVDVVKQESDITEHLTIDFKKTFTKGSLVFRESGWYNNLLYFDQFDCYPAFTFTNESNRQVSNKPDNGYLKEISKGLKDFFNLDYDLIVNCFSSKKGGEDHFTKKIWHG